MSEDSKFILNILEQHLEQELVWFDDNNFNSKEKRYDIETYQYRLNIQNEINIIVRFIKQRSKSLEQLAQLQILDELVDEYDFGIKE